MQELKDKTFQELAELTNNQFQSCFLGFIKGGLFSESAIRFFRSPKKNIPKNYPELEI